MNDLREIFDIVSRLLPESVCRLCGYDNPYMDDVPDYVCRQCASRSNAWGNGIKSKAPAENLRLPMGPMPKRLSMDPVKAEAKNLDYIKDDIGVSAYVDVNWPGHPGDRVIVVDIDCTGNPKLHSKAMDFFSEGYGYESYIRDLYDPVIADSSEHFVGALIPLEPTFDVRVERTLTSSNLFDTPPEDMNRFAPDELKKLDASVFVVDEHEDERTAEFILDCWAGRDDSTQGQSSEEIMKDFTWLAKHLGKI